MKKKMTSENENRPGIAEIADVQLAELAAGGNSDADKSRKDIEETKKMVVVQAGAMAGGLLLAGSSLF